MSDPVDFDEFYETLQSNDKNKTTEDCLFKIYIYYAQMILLAIPAVAYDDDSDGSSLWDSHSDSGFDTQSLSLRL